MVHDVLQTEAARKDMRPFIFAFKPYLPWMLRPAYTVAGADRGKIMRLLEIWAEWAIITVASSQWRKRRTCICSSGSTRSSAEDMRLFVI